MKWLANIAREIVGLFVDDGMFALAIVVWVAVVWAGSRYLHRPTVAAILLALGLALLLVFSVLRFSRRSAK